MKQAIVLCADDYAHTGPISRAILDLAANKRISALSCMTASPHWPEHGRWLKDVRDTVDIGLHITLVDEAPLTRMPKTAPRGRLPDIGALIMKCYLGQIDLGEIDAEIRAQEAAFEAVMDFPPQHIDGHLHTHVLPGIRGLVLTMAHALNPRPWVRNVAERLSLILKRGVAVPKASFLAALGTAFAREAGMSKDMMNDGFSGIYGFSPADGDYGVLFEKFAAATARRHVILCHPGTAEDIAAHATMRGAEYAFLRGGAFLDSLASRNLQVARFSETGA